MLEMWAGLALAYSVPKLPPSFSILAVATAVWAATFLVRRHPRSTGISPPPHRGPHGLTGEGWTVTTRPILRGAHR